MTGDLYVQSVIENLPYGSPLREQIAMELRSNIAERVAHGEPLDGVLRQLGDPLMLAESYLASILGKRMLGILVVRESGARISLGQSLLRQLPFLGQFFFIDALFVLFTERKQRAFEILSKTRAVTA